MTLKLYRYTAYMLSLAALYFTPLLFASAQPSGQTGGTRGGSSNAPTVDSGNQLRDYAGDVVGFFNDIVIPLILAIAFVVFIWGVFKFFIFGASDEGARESGKQLMIWGIVGFVIIISIVGIVALLGNATGLTADEPIPLPRLTN